MRPSPTAVWLAVAVTPALLAARHAGALAQDPGAGLDNIRAGMPTAGLENIRVGGLVGEDPKISADVTPADAAAGEAAITPAAATEAALPEAAATEAAPPVEAATDTWLQDAYHYPAWRDGKHDALYTEWWYFNLHDPRAGVDAIFSYFVTNPDDIVGQGMVQMVAVAYTAEGAVSAIDRYPATEFEARAVGGGGEARDSGQVGPASDPGESGANVRIGDNRAWREQDGTYRVSGQSRNGRLAWELRYEADGTPWFGAERMGVGRMAWERMSWLVQMPRARVSGRMRIDGREVEVRGTGYHDHNWGEWIPADATWNWAQFSSARVALEVGDFIGKPVGVVALDLDGARTVFTPDQYSLVHTRWGWDRVNRLFFPTESLLTADNGALRLEVTLRALATEPLRGDLPRPLRDLIIYEQTARYEGRVWEWVGVEGMGGASAGGASVDGTESAGEWRLSALVRGMGFKEWTGKKF